MGAAIGAGVGATSGFLYGKHQEGEQEAYQRGVADGKQSQSRQSQIVARRLISLLSDPGRKVEPKIISVTSPASRWPV